MSDATTDFSDPTQAAAFYLADFQCDGTQRRYSEGYMIFRRTTHNLLREVQALQERVARLEGVVESVREALDAAFESAAQDDNRSVCNLCDEIASILPQKQETTDA